MDSSIRQSAAAPLDGWDELLLELAVRCAGEAELAGLLRHVGEGLRRLPGYVAGGLASYDAECEELFVYPAGGEGGAGSAGEFEVPLEQSEVPLLLDGRRTYESGDLAEERSLRIGQRLYEAGARRQVSAPLVVNKQLVGFVYAGFLTGGEAVAGAVIAQLEALARVTTPTFWNCITQMRFARGDHRRDVLLELSKVINTTLALEAVLREARRVIGQLDGHCVSSIGILSGDGETYRAYRHYEATRAGMDSPPEPETIATASSPMSWTLAQGRTYESEDLERAQRFEIDGQLALRGVRRYVAAPMFVRGRIIGGFLFGTTNPRPTRRIDLWMYEHIALELALAIDNALKHQEIQSLNARLQQQNVYLREEIQSHHNFLEIVGAGRAMQRVFDAIQRIAPLKSTVLITGETGVGKELVARAIHAGSDRAEQPMVKINCASIPESLVESELFGHERGAFTSATARRVGRFELARDGTLFLDEIGELPLPIQAKLLRVLQDGDFERVGGSETLTTNARIIAATNRNLLKAIEDGTFRRDLYYRLNVFPIEVPPLAERREDIPAIVEAFVARFARQMGKQIRSIDRASMDYLCRREWPGNVRELRHVIERAMILCDGEALRIEGAESAPEPVPAPAEHRAAPAGGLFTLEQMEARHIREALSHCGGKIEGPRGAAAALGLKASTLRFRMKRLGIRRTP